jgi:DNA mismatch repair protein MutH
MIEMSITEALTILRRHLGKKITTKNPKNKGWRGNAVEELLGASQDNSHTPDSFAFELKTSVCRLDKDGVCRPKDGRLAICMVTTDSLKESFHNSICWHKLRRILLVGTFDECNGTYASFATIRFVRCFDFQDDSEIYKKLKEDYEHLQKYVKRNGFDKLSRSIITPNRLLHIGTKGCKRSSTRAFYLTNKAFS